MDNENMQDLIGKLSSFANDNNISQNNINSIFNMLKNQNIQNSNSNTNTQDNPSQNIDIETIMKMKSIIDKMNSKDDPRSNLLKSLKPYLNDSRKSKVDQYIGLMNMSKVMDVFPFMNGDKSNDK